MREKDVHQCGEMFMEERGKEKAATGGSCAGNTGPTFHHSNDSMCSPVCHSPHQSLLCLSPSPDGDFTAS